jgi:hypothetical protein
MILTIVEVPMKRQWHIQRQFHATEDGAQRWDQAYQLLLHWSSLNEARLHQSPPPLRGQPLLEDTDENGYLCPRLDAAPEPGADD